MISLSEDGSLTKGMGSACSFDTLFHSLLTHFRSSNNHLDEPSHDFFFNYSLLIKCTYNKKETARRERHVGRQKQQLYPTPPSFPPLFSLSPNICD